MNNKGYMTAVSVFITMLVVVSIITLSYMPIVNSVSSVKEGGEKVLQSIEERNVIERVHAFTHTNPGIDADFQFEDLEYEVRIMGGSILLMRDGRVVRTIDMN